MLDPGDGGRALHRPHGVESAGRDHRQEAHHGHELHRISVDGSLTRGRAGERSAQPRRDEQAPRDLPEDEVLRVVPLGGVEHDEVGHDEPQPQRRGQAAQAVRDTPEQRQAGEQRQEQPDVAEPEPWPRLAGVRRHPTEEPPDRVRLRADGPRQREPDDGGRDDEPQPRPTAIGQQREPPERQAGQHRVGMGDAEHTDDHTGTERSRAGTTAAATPAARSSRQSRHRGPSVCCAARTARPRSCCRPTGERRACGHMSGAATSRCPIRRCAHRPRSTRGRPRR